MPSPIGGILEGYMSARQLRRQREQDMADKAIQQARMASERQRLDLDRQEFALKGKQFDLEGKKFDVQKANTEEDNKRQSQALADLNKNRAENIAARKQQAALARDRLTKLTDYRDRKLVLDAQKMIMDSQEFRERYGQDEEEALIQAMRSFDLTKQIVGQGLGSSSPTGETPQPGAEGQLFGAPTANISELIRGSGASNEGLPLVTAQERALDTGSDMRAERTKALKAEYQFIEPKGKARLDFLRSSTRNKDANTKLVNTMLRYLPQQLQQKLDKGRADIGLAQKRMEEITQGINQARALQAQAAKVGGYLSGNTIKLLPNDPREMLKEINQMRSLIGQTTASYTKNQDALSEQRILLETLPNAITNVESGIYPDSDSVPEDPVQKSIYTKNLIAHYYAMLRSARNNVNTLTPIVEDQASTMERLNKEKLNLIKKQNDALNTTPITKVKPPQPTRKAPPRRNTYNDNRPRLQLGKPANPQRTPKKTGARQMKTKSGISFTVD